MLRPYVSSVGNRDVRWLEPYRAALELRHFRVRIEHRIGEQVGGGLAEVERHEYLTARHALRNAGRAHHRVAARRQPYEVAVLEPELARIVGVDLDDGRGLTLVEARGASRHRAGMPVIQLASRVHHERIFLVGELDRRR